MAAILTCQDAPGRDQDHIPSRPARPTEHAAVKAARQHRQQRPVAGGRCANSLPPSTVQLVPPLPPPASSGLPVNTDGQPQGLPDSDPKKTGASPATAGYLTNSITGARRIPHRRSARPAICCAATGSARRNRVSQPDASGPNQRGHVAIFAPIALRYPMSAGQSHDAPVRRISVISTPITASRPSICCAASSRDRRNGPILP